MKNFVISLKQSTTRFDQIKNQLNALGLPFTIIEAIDGNEIDRYDPYFSWCRLLAQIKIARRKALH